MPKGLLSIPQISDDVLSKTYIKTLENYQNRSFLMIIFKFESFLIIDKQTLSKFYE